MERKKSHLRQLRLVAFSFPVRWDQYRHWIKSIKKKKKATRERMKKRRKKIKDISSSMVILA